MKKKQLITVICGLFIFMFVSFFHGPALELYADGNKDYILVLDTSLSMVGQGGKDILNRVKGSLTNYINRLEEGDTISFMTFDTDVRAFPDIFIQDNNDKEILRKYISMEQAKGKWTFTLNMISKVLDKAKELEKKDVDKERQRIIVIMTDGLDDPPPNLRKQKFNIREILKGHEGKDYFIFLFNLGDKQANKKFVELQNLLKEKVTPYTKVINVNKDVSKVDADIKKGVEEATEEKDRKERTFLSSPYFIGILVIALVFLIIFFLKRYSDLKVSGKLEYWNHELLDPYIMNFNLTRQNAREIAVGKGIGCLLNIRDFEISSSFVITAVRDKGEIKPSIKINEGCNIEFVNRDAGEFLMDGDIFKCNNYTFKYFAE